MASFSVIYHQLKLLPVKTVALKVLRKMSFLNRLAGERIDMSRSTYKLRKSRNNPRSGVFLLPAFSELSESDKERLLSRSLEINAHVFDLLGSGKKTFSYDMEVDGFEGEKYRMRRPTIPEVVADEAEYIASNVYGGYDPLPWNMDFRSGYVWPLNIYGLNLKPAPDYGVDIKNPWELGRVQHLPLLALGANSMFDTDPNFFTRALAEFKSQISDFRGSCPPSMGVQWSSPMDVGIRMSNILIAWDWFSQSGSSAGHDFRASLINMAEEHLAFLLKHLEYAEGQPNNHYLANLCSIFIICRYLIDDSENRLIARWALTNIITELKRQFLPDGSNFEGSTHYHLFAVEMFLVAFASLGTLDAETKRLLIEDATLPSNVKVYTNDSPAIRGELEFLLFGTEAGESAKKFKRHLSNIFGVCLSIVGDSEGFPRMGDEDGGSYIDLNLGEGENRKNRHYDIVKEEKSVYNKFYSANLPPHILALYLDAEAKNKIEGMGVYSIKAGESEVLVKNSRLGLYGRGGHNHNDNLSFVLLKNGRELITESGTYSYTGSPEMRNLFRSTAYHNTPQIGDKEINPFGYSNEELFWYRKDKSKAKTVSHTENTYIGKHYGFGKVMERGFILTSDKLLIKDSYGGRSGLVSRLHLHPSISTRPKGDKIELHEDGKWLATVGCDTAIELDEYWFSPSYGSKQKSVVIIVKSEKPVINWSISL